MKILIIDRDSMFSNLLASKMKAAGHEVIESAIKHDGIEQIGTKHVDAIYFDPSPLTDAKSILLQIRRMVHTYPYLVLMGHDLGKMDGVRAGCNDGLSKPLDPEALTHGLENAVRMCALIKKLGDTSFDFPSAGGVISKSAFNQLFISAMDRVSRHEETSRVLFIKLSNYDDIKLDEGKLAADFAVSKIAQNLSRLRRQSDIIGQTNVNEYALLLQRPQNPTEAVEAAKRFGVAMDAMREVTEKGLSDVVIDLDLIDLPAARANSITPAESQAVEFVLPAVDSRPSASFAPPNFFFKKSIHRVRALQHKALPAMPVLTSVQVKIFPLE